MNNFRFVQVLTYCSRYIHDEDDEMFESLNEKIQGLVDNDWKRYNYRNEKFSIGYLMEHKFVYDFIADHCQSSYEFFRLDIEKSYEETLKIQNNKEFKNIVFTNKGLKNISKGKLLDISDRFDLSHKIDEKFGRDSKMIYLGTKSDGGFPMRGVGYMYYDFLLYPYKIREDLLLCVGNKENYINFVKFYLGVTKFNIFLSPHNYASQDAEDEDQLAYHKACCEFLEKRIEKD